MHHRIEILTEKPVLPLAAPHAAVLVKALAPDMFVIWIPRDLGFAEKILCEFLARLLRAGAGTIHMSSTLVELTRLPSTKTNPNPHPHPSKK